MKREISFFVLRMVLNMPCTHLLLNICKFSIKDLFNKFEKIRQKLQNFSLLQQESCQEDFQESYKKVLQKSVEFEHFVLGIKLLFRTLGIVVSVRVYWLNIELRLLQQLSNQCNNVWELFGCDNKVMMWPFPLTAILCFTNVKKVKITKKTLMKT